jgi:hypothetical protein
VLKVSLKVAVVRPMPVFNADSQGRRSATPRQVLRLPVVLKVSLKVAVVRLCRFSTLTRKG